MAYQRAGAAMDLPWSRPAFQEISPQGLLQVQFITRSRYAANGFHPGVHHSSPDLWDNLYQKTIRHRASFEHQCARSSPELKMLSKSTDRKSLHQNQHRAGFRDRQ